MDNKFKVGDVKSFNVILDEMYNSLKEFIKEKGGFICCTKTKGRDKIYSLEFVNSGEVTEWNVLGVRVVNDNIEYCADYTWYDDEENYSEDELSESFDWYSLKNSANYYIQTMYNIWENIEQYVD